MPQVYSFERHGLKHSAGWTDEEVMLQVGRGDVSLAAELFDRHHRKLFRFCWRMTGDVPLSEDLVQEVFLRILRHRETFGGSSFEVWMYAIARNALRDSWRKRGREAPLQADLAARDTEDAAQRAQENALLERALLSLPEDKREVLVMSRYLNMSHTQIAAVLGCEEGTSRARLHRAMQSLKDLYHALAGRGTGRKV